MYDIRQMRRSLSILLMLVFGLGPLTLTVQQNEETVLPACCRRLGAHHCAMSSDAGLQQLNSQLPAFKAPSRCPLFPLHGNASPSRIAAIAAQFHFVATPIVELQLSRASGAHARSIHLDASRLRGPPLTSL